MAPAAQSHPPTSRLAGALPAGTPVALEWLLAGTIWQLQAPLDLYSRIQGEGLATQAAEGRHLEILETGGSANRLRVRLLEDGYPGWINPSRLLGHAIAAPRPRPRLWQRHGIEQRIPKVLAYAQAAADRPNTYLWGGSLGPNFDCSGLVQTAYASEGIWVPRDAYLQERFCQPVAVASGVTHRLEPGDLIFFGSPQRCTHVGLHLGDGHYLHSSGIAHGHNGLAIDNLCPHNRAPVASHYRQTLRGAGRVMRGHDGSPLPA